MRRTRTSLVAALATAMVLGAAGTAQADERRCDGAIGPETVRGDLVVPSGEVCDLAGTRVLGNTTVEPDAELFAEQADLRGNVEAGSNAYVDLFETTLAGNLKLADSLGATTTDSTLANLESTGSEFVDLFGGSVSGNVKIEGAETSVIGDTLEVGGTLETTGAQYFDLYDSVVNGNFYVRDTAEGSIFCGNDLNGNSEFLGNMGLLTIGSPDQACDGNTVNGNVKVENNEADSEISDNDINGNLSCYDNEPPPAGGGNRVEGNKEGQCRAL
jgi:hypothetical protein